MLRIGPLDNSRETYFDFIGIENDKEFINLCFYFKILEPANLIKKLNEMNRLEKTNYRQYHGGFKNSQFDDVKRYIETVLNVGQYFNYKKKLTDNRYNLQRILDPIKKEYEMKKEILASKGLKNHNVNNMTIEAKIKHVRICEACNKICNFNLLSDDELMNNKIELDTDKLNDLEAKIKNLDSTIKKYDDKIKMIKDKVFHFTKYLMNTYLKYKVFVKDHDKQNDKITFCVDIGAVVVEVPFTEIIAKAIGEYAKEEFQKKL